MIKTFTQTDLMRYLYQETTEEESREIDRALLCDGELKALYNELCDMILGGLARSQNGAAAEPPAQRRGP